MTRRLTGWKDIAKYIGVTDRTARRYHKRYGLQVDRTPTGKPSITCEAIDCWFQLDYEEKIRLKAVKRRKMLDNFGQPQD